MVVLSLCLPFRYMVHFTFLSKVIIDWVLKYWNAWAIKRWLYCCWRRILINIVYSRGSQQSHSKNRWKNYPFLKVTFYKGFSHLWFFFKNCHMICKCHIDVIFQLIDAYLFCKQQQTNVINKWYFTTFRMFLQHSVPFFGLWWQLYCKSCEIARSDLVVSVSIWDTMSGLCAIILTSSISNSGTDVSMQFFSNEPSNFMFFSRISLLTI